MSEELVIPLVPVSVMVLLNFFAPYATALIVQPPWPTVWKKWVAVGVAVVLGAVALALAYFGFGEPVPAWPQMLLLGVLVSQTSYDLLRKKSADAWAVKTAITQNER